MNTTKTSSKVQAVAREIEIEGVAMSLAILDDGKTDVLRRVYAQHKSGIVHGDGALFGFVSPKGVWLGEGTDALFQYFNGRQPVKYLREGWNALCAIRRTHSYNYGVWPVGSAYRNPEGLMPVLGATVASVVTPVTEDATRVTRLEQLPPALQEQVSRWRAFTAQTGELTQNQARCLVVGGISLDMVLKGTVEVGNLHRTYGVGPDAVSKIKRALRGAQEAPPLPPHLEAIVESSSVPATEDAEWWRENWEETSSVSSYDADGTIVTHRDLIRKLKG